MKKQYLYKKVKKWKKKPDRYGVIFGWLLLLISILILYLKWDIDHEGFALIFIFTLMLVYSFRTIFKSKGEGKQIYYLKIKRKNGRT